jgi:hypothetical protein
LSKEVIGSKTWQSMSCKLGATVDRVMEFLELDGFEILTNL